MCRLFFQGVQVEFNTAYHTMERAEQDAADLYKAGQGKWGTDEASFIRILLTSPPHYVELLNDVYCRKYGNAIVIAIEKEFGGDAKRALLFYGGCAFAKQKMGLSTCVCSY